MTSARPFKFENLPRYTRQQVALYESLSQNLSAKLFAPDFATELETLLSEIFRGGCRVMGGKITSLAANELLATAPRLGCFGIIGVAPSTDKIIFDIDPNLCSLAIDRLLGGSGEPSRMVRPWTDVETGILSYPMLKVLAHIGQGLQTGHEMALTLDQIISSLDDVRGTIEAGATYHQIGYRLDFGRRIGYGRILLPDALLTEHFRTVPDPETPTPQQLASMRKNVQSISTRRHQLRVVGAHLDVTPEQMREIEPGDIIVLENHTLRLEADGIQGGVQLFLDRNQKPQMDAQVHNRAGHAQLEIVHFIAHTQPQEEPMVDDTQASEEHVEAADAYADDAPQAISEPDDNLPETDVLLQQTDSSVAVELGRIKMTTAQLIRLRKGQMLRLPRGTHDPVNLVVNGQLFAKGELIEVEGELGVRLTQLQDPS